ncbi:MULTISPECIES: glycine cleavage system protein H [Aerococcus]|uniref:Glycine cleavage system protein H n=2 Tax=Aerococcus TaxID=1375 RepID=A0A178HFX0_9LACT|nr:MULTISPECIES: glycine cleavage system protein H [Aerococcus]KAA9221084.1 glycine cleavage system protein H [Aerococcus loyolae]KAA9264686.1 glycine cleavage system protein H [Aerococcus loyolae]MCY3026279.1 glycine cleavage system protein H [Aerococcus loyolae]MCY3026673.1 glycine cleavage system protein H [Aerococcus loyolae]MCY3029827.1 glycine cleavage system protein H [Aerococcus loyolae]
MEKVFTDNGLWLTQTADKQVIIGLSKAGQEEFGDISFINYLVDQDLVAGEAFVSIEAEKAVTDILAPLSGKVVGKNEKAEGTPTDLNSDKDNLNWLMAVEPSSTFDPTAFKSEETK